ncbi:MAG: LapA family protein [Spirochaetaceae bacterium]|nr:LapA family protein [Spirochaetaceae bacterium]
MAQIIFNIVFLLVLAAVIILNVGHRTSIDLFFREFQDVPVVAIVFLSFVLGVLYAFCYTVYWKIKKKIRKPAPEKGKKKDFPDDIPPLPEEPPVSPLL